MIDEELEVLESEELNVIMGSLLRPRETISYVMEYDWGIKYWVLVYLFGFNYVLGAVTSNEYPFNILTVVVMLFMAPISGTIQLYISGWAFMLAGKMLGGVADSDDIRHSILWSNIPNMVMIPIGFVLFIIGSNNMRHLFLGRLWLVLLYGALMLISLTVAVRCYFNMLSMISEVHEFSLGRAFLSTLIPALIIVVVVFMLVLILSI